MRLPRAVAVVTSIVAIAMAVAPGAVSVTPTVDTPLSSGAFRPLTAEALGRVTATTNPAQASADASRNRLDGGGGVFVDPEAARDPAGPDAALPWTLPGPGATVPDPSPLVVVRPTPTPTPRPAPVAVAGSGSGGGGSTTSGGAAWTSSWASFYGPGLYGNGLACPGILTETLQGVAHRTLPCGTLVTFRNPSNGMVLTVPVVDRGPYVDGREWDLTGGACLVLDFCYTGLIQWHLGAP